MLKAKFTQLSIAFLAVVALVGAVPVFADDNNPLQDNQIGICTFIGPICTAIGLGQGNDPGNAQRFLLDRIGFALSLLFIGIILMSVFIVIQAGIKYIQSQGDEGQIKDAQKAIKSVFLGIGMLFVGIVGIILVLVVFNATGLLTPVEGDQNGCRIEGGILVCSSGSGDTSIKTPQN